MFLFLFFNLFCTFSLFTAPFPVDSLLLQTDISPELQEKACEFSREKCYEILAQRIILDNRQEAHKAEVSKLALLFQRAFTIHFFQDDFLFLKLATDANSLGSFLNFYNYSNKIYNNILNEKLENFK